MKLLSPYIHFGENDLLNELADLPSDLRKILVLHHEKQRTFHVIWLMH